MKISAMFILTCFVFIATSLANPVTVNEAEAAAISRIARDNQSESRTITNSFPLRDNLSNRPVAYVFELSPAGYVITSADHNIAPVIAYSYLNNCRINGESESILMDLVRRDMSQRLSSQGEIQEELIEANLSSWQQYVSGNFTGTFLEQWPPAGSTPTEGWLEENWTQNSPYNSYCPMDLISSTRSVAGCPAVAMGMILNFLETTNYTRFDDDDDYYHNYHEYYWIDDDCAEHDFPSWPVLNEYLTELDSLYDNQIPLNNLNKAALVYASGAACKQVYTSSVSGTFGVTQAFNAYQRFAFSDCELLDSSSDSLLERLSGNMMDARPAHLAIIDAASQYGHNVVLDGYNTDEFYHINFGWGGSSNAWYQFPLSGMPYSMNIIEGIVLDIIPGSQSIEGSSSGSATNPVTLSCTTNPSSGSVHFILSTDLTAEINLSVYTPDGRMVDTVAQGCFHQGSHDICWSVPTAAAGIYILRASSSLGVETVKFALIR